MDATYKFGGCYDIHSTHDCYLMIDNLLIFLLTVGTMLDKYDRTVVYTLPTYS